MSTKKLQILGSLGNNLELDTTLEQEGKAADAKVVGDALAQKQPVGDYALTSDVNALQAKIGDTSVSEQISEAVSSLGDLATKDTVSKSDLASDVQTSLDKADTALQSYTESDPTVPAWAKAATKPSYTAAEVGALSVDTFIPSIDGLATEAYVDGKIDDVDTTLNNKVDKVSGKGLSTNDYTTAEKNKLAGIAEGANKTVVDSALSSTSTNPVQNKVVNTAITNLNTLVGNKSVSEQITSAIANKSDVGHNHDTEYDAKGAADTALASAKTYADSATATVKNDLLNGAGGAYDTLKELGDLINDNQDAIIALETVAAGKADAEHGHDIDDITDLQTQLSAKVPTSRTVNGKALSANIALTASDVGAMSSTDPVGTGSFSLNRKSGTQVGQYSHAEGYSATAIGWYSHAEGEETTANGTGSHAEGYKTTASGEYSHAEGEETTASSWSAHAEGKNTTASGLQSHAEGEETTASGNWSHAEGRETTASGLRSHAEGSTTIASGEASHAEGYGSVAKNDASHAEGMHTIAGSDYQHVQGQYNVEDTTGTYAHIVGNGSSDDARSNAHTLDWEGNAWFQGDVYVGSTSGTNKDEGSKKLATEEYVNIRVPAWTEADEGSVLRIVNGTPTWASISSAEGVSF